jgi:hypothetical protein
LHQVLRLALVLHDAESDTEDEALIAIHNYGESIVPAGDQLPKKVDVP